jgi:hypothetical protein
MGLTFGVIAVFAVLMVAVGLLMTRNVRWDSIPVLETAMRPPRQHGGELIVAISVVVLVGAVGVLLWFWGLIALPH